MKKNFKISLKNIEYLSDSGKLFLILVNIMEKLRSENGCMWDREQTHESIKRNLVEEAYEAVDTIEEKKYQELSEELGDILLQVVFHSKIAADNRQFNICDVLKKIIKKLVRRHPHVFDNKIVNSSHEILTNWEEIKKEERRIKDRENKSMFSDIPKIIPSLHYAYEIQSRASRFGFDWDSLNGVIQKIKEEFKEIDAEYKKGDIKKLGEEIGDILFSIVNLSRHMSIDSEKSLKDACNKFIKRFDFMEKYAEERGLDFKNMPLDKKDKLWEIAKKNL
ncbi:MAG: nucleoside triphosphate pyrophosphohydrolase [Actinobacteria bacterium]|nr:nucleoside triphosphate pyrophosphohydrolase [Actinomycetota bacterium]MBM3712044.1 nucleoside triphosphate pyrophosphohydrolase [Actinomycetota bacterium]